jgi:hypothetical protein
MTFYLGFGCIQVGRVATQSIRSTYQGESK